HTPVWGAAFLFPDTRRAPRAGCSAPTPPPPPPISELPPSIRPHKGREALPESRRASCVGHERAPRRKWPEPTAEARVEASVPIPKFASPGGTLSCELRDQKDTSKPLTLVWVFGFKVLLILPWYSL